jgi:tripartite ATP-independent transporter DctM subunit
MPTIVLFAGLLSVGVPIAIVLALTSLAYIWLSGNLVLYQSFAQQMFSGIESYGLLAIPLFVLLGEILHEGGITRRLIRVASVFVGRARGGLAYVNILANMIMAAFVGSAAAQIAVMSRVMADEMAAKGYDRAFACATTCAGGLTAPIIPPSMVLIVFAVLAQIPVADMFIAGIVPGLMIGAGTAIVVFLVGLRRGLPRGERIGARAAARALLAGLPAAIIPLSIVGGILGGFATPTEIAALACLAAALIGGLVYRELDWRRIPAMLLRTAINASVVLFLVAAASVFGWVIVFEGVPQRLAAWLQALTRDPTAFLLLVMVFLLLVGMVIDGIAAMILLVPILLPIATSVYGIDPVHFGIVMSINLVLGLLTPPVGAGLLISAQVAGERPMRIFRAMIPFVLMTLAILVLLCIEPRITLVLL